MKSFQPESKNIRADRLLFSLGLAESREKASALIWAGEVFRGEQKVAKPSEMLPPDAPLRVRQKDHPYVSRGGLKLEKALKEFYLDVSGKTAMDIGSSTGGFTDCLLRHGAEKVFAVDCGTNQLDWRLRSDSRVVCMEQTNFRHLKREEISDKIDIIVADVSFISLKLLFSQFRAFIDTDGDAVLLVKPQFEAGKGEAKKGIVHGEERRLMILDDVSRAANPHFKEVGRTVSPLTGKKKSNIEFLLHLKPL